MRGSVFTSNPRIRMFSIIAGMVAAAAVAGYLLAGHPRESATLAVLAAAAVFLGIRYPEVAFVFFLTAGFYKNDPHVQLPGIDLTVFFGAMTLLGVAVGFWRKRIKPTLPPKNMLLPFIVIAWFSAMSLMYTPAPVYGMDKFERLVTITAFSLVAPFYLFRERRQFRNFCIAFVAVALLMLWQVWGAADMGSVQLDETSLGSNYIAFGYAEGAAFLLVFLYFFQADRSLFRRALYICLLTPAIIYGLMVSGARGPLLSLALTLAGILAFATRPHIYSRRMVFWTLTLWAALALFFYFGLHDFARMSARLGVLTEGGGDSALIRIDMGKVALKAMMGLPNLFTGLGLGGFSTYYMGYDGVRGAYPHNMFLEVGSEIGIAGVVALVFLVSLCFRKIRTVLKRADGIGYYSAVAAMSYFFFTFLNAMKSGDINDNRFLFSAVGIVYALGEVESDEVKG